MARTELFYAELVALPLFEHLQNVPMPPTSMHVTRMLGLDSPRGIGSRLKASKLHLALHGIAFDEAIHRRARQGTTYWYPGPRFRQALHVLQELYDYVHSDPDADKALLDDVSRDYNGPRLVLRSLKSTGQLFHFAGGLGALTEALHDPDWSIEGDLRYLEEVFIHGIVGSDRRHTPHPSLAEDGIRIRGRMDYAGTHVPGSIGTGRLSGVYAYVCEAVWVERRLRLTDPVRQLYAARRDTAFGILRHPDSPWHDINPNQRFRYVNWVAGRTYHKRRYPPPLHMRLRCWYDVTLEDESRRRTVHVLQEGLRGDTPRTCLRAQAAWHAADPHNRPLNAPVVSIRIAKKQPRPMFD